MSSAEFRRNIFDQAKFGHLILSTDNYFKIVTLKESDFVIFLQNKFPKGIILFSFSLKYYSNFKEITILFSHVFPKRKLGLTCYFP